VAFLFANKTLENPPATAITKGLGTIITFGSFNPDTLYSSFIAGIILEGSMGAVLKARLIHN
jgi:hypothetical protein